MKLLNIVGHDALERNNISLFSSLGFEVQTTGSYVDHLNPNPDIQHKIFKRPLDPLIGTNFNKDLSEEFRRLNPNGYYPGRSRLVLSKEFLDKFDVILLSWITEPMHSYFSLLKDKLVIHQTLGQSDANREVELDLLRKKGLKVVRISEFEKYFPKYSGADSIIDLDIDSDRFRGWKGNEEAMLTVNSYVTGRLRETNFTLYDQIVSKVPSKKLYGGGNPVNPLQYPYILGPISESKLLLEYQSCRAFFSLGTKPCPVVLSFKEAMSVGMPVVTWGPKLGGATYSAHTFIDNGVNGFYSDDPNELVDICNQLMTDFSLCKKISINARQTAIDNFSSKVIATKWRDFFNRLGLSV